ncbi:hypothetical protein E2C01_093125 [Portunus trituberculatus]|uniref:Uncharacterized protein n=1 Tax=Portunus trituberculatus TaxID=210409 RepID=A0A5B7JTP6_PORTR|nr:hypothetical protein [Portunus trituberculatus]
MKSVRAEPLLSTHNQAPQSCAPASSSETLKPTMDLLSAAISEAQIQSDRESSRRMPLIDPPNSQSPQNPKQDQLAPRNRKSSHRSHSPSQGSRKRSRHISSPGMSSEKPPSKYSRRHLPSRERSKSPSSSLRDEFEEFHRFRDQCKRETRF